MSNDIYIFHAKRTAIGKIGGSLAPVRADDLLAELLKDFKKNCNFDLKKIDDVISGCANQAGEDNRNISRMSVILAGFPYEVPAVTLNRLCGSSLDATIDAFCRISAGLASCILVGGVESMSRAPWVVSKASSPYGRDQKMYDTSLGWRFPNPKMKEMFPLYSMGETAEEVASRYKVSREDQDQYAYSSHQKALKAIESGAFKDQIVPIEVKLRKSSYTFDTDEGPRKESTLEKLASLRAVFKDSGSVTAGNSSSLNDGAALLGIASEEFIKANNLTPLAKITGAGVAGLEPNVMGLGPIYATRKLCERYNKKASDFDLVELNEAFAVQALACQKELELDLDKININGGAIALGHPLGCSGARIITTLIHNLKEKQKTKGLATMCIGLGQGVAISIEKN
jgi:acetyl-CoA acyltransferase